MFKPALRAQLAPQVIYISFYGDTLPIPKTVDLVAPDTNTLTAATVASFYASNEQANFQPIADKLLAYKQQKQLDDWLFYQLIRATAEALSPKAAGYPQYTLYKWLLLIKTGYDATVSVSGNKLLLYVQSNDEVFDVPYHVKNNKSYVCMNYHDYGSINFNEEIFKEVPIGLPGNLHSFTFKVTSLPNFKPENYAVKNLQFSYEETEYHFNVLVNEQVKKIFANYPVVDYSFYFNIPVSKQTYSSLIPLLRQNVKHLNQKNGVDYLMRFTRYAFAYETDTKIFGREKRLSPEQTLLYEYSDCEDRSAFFFYLVREIYNLPMIVISYPDHITIAIKFNKPVGTPVYYNGQQYSICEATPQRSDLSLGQGIHKLNKMPYEVVYAYNPQK